MSSSSVCIVTPSYNQGEYIEKTIRSVIDQDYPNLHYVIMDGGSTDGSPEIIRRYSESITHWQSSSDDGQSSAINRGFEIGQGEILGWINSDDYLLPGCIPAVVEFLDSHPGCVAACGWTTIVDGDGNQIGLLQPTGEITPSRLAGWDMAGGTAIPQPSTFFRAGAFRDVGGLDEALANCMDVDLWIRLARHGSFGLIDKPLAAFRDYPENKTNSRFWPREMELLDICRKYLGEEAVTKRFAHLLTLDEAVGCVDMARLIRDKVPLEALLKGIFAKFRARLARKRQR